MSNHAVSDRPIDDNGISLWLIPSEPESSLLTRIIDELSTHERDSPAFMPHITLLSPLPGQNVSALVDTFKAKVIQVQSTGTGPLEVDLRPAQRGDQYFQSVLAPVKPVSRLLNIRRACEDAYDSHPPEYFPHLSLLYGDLTPKRREELVEIIKSGQLGNLPKSVRVEEAVFVNCSGPADGWKVLERVRL